MTFFEGFALFVGLVLVYIGTAKIAYDDLREREKEVKKIRGYYGRGEIKGYI